MFGMTDDKVAVTSIQVAEYLTYESNKRLTSNIVIVYIIQLQFKFSV